MARPDLSHVPKYYHKYIAYVNADGINEALEQHVNFFESYLKNLPLSKWEYAYSPGKWTIKEVVQHIIDSERVFAYRALRIARKDPTPLPGFDENMFALNANANKRKVGDLVDEFSIVRSSSLALFKSFGEEQLNNIGVANDQPISVEGIGFIIAGHALHHVNVINERYL